ncbi:Tad domain-containing protein [uncultured Nocardioides sp.]|uniref:Tad domain-containing protein n=1 Tax=uncultured Nocardioides sp. TaxID=198441 RepID=UPI0026167F80|nr:Tad domain-containing protein [uncultured Nocardioides sp.]
MWTRRHRRGEDGYVAVVVAVLFATVMLAVAAIGVDVARWWVAAERVQTAADSAALAGVVFLPDNLPRAVQTARTSAKLNGFEHGVNAQVDVTFGDRRSQLAVSISTNVANQFGSAVGVETATISRRATADYTSPAPMGSPCNVFGNEPPGGTASAAGPSSSGPRDSTIPVAYRSICSAEPNFWAAIEGPQTDKQNGDRYSTASCTLRSRDGAGPLPYGCASSINAEATYPDGYFYSIKVPQSAVGTAITLQLYDPAFFNTGASCTSMPNSDGGNYLNNRNPYSTESYDSYFRYTRVDQVQSSYRTYSRRFCTGDSVPLRGTSAPETRQYAPTTSFAVRAANDAQDPTQGAALTGCTAQFAGQLNPPTLAELTSTSSGYRQPAAQLFHQWVKLCSFTPTRAGDYYLQVRTNVALPGGVMPHEYRGSTVNVGYYPYRAFSASSQANRPTTYRYDGNSAVHAASTGTPYGTGEGVNAFGIRAISTATDISVSGWSRMPMLQNVPNSTATFNLLRVLPAAAGQSISFEFYDVADGADDVGTVQVLPPVRAGETTAPAPYDDCQEALNDEAFADTGVGCKVSVSNADHNGQVQRMSIPIPDDYTCKDSELTGCWFQVRIALNGNITDFTTWDASLEGDPVRLIE